MSFRFDHNNLNVLDLEKSLAFYEKALGQIYHRLFRRSSDGP